MQSLLPSPAPQWEQTDTHQLKAWRGRLNSEVWWALERRLLMEGVTWQGNQGAMTAKRSILMWPLAGVLAGESVGTPTGSDAVKNDAWGGNLLSPQGETSGNIKQGEKTSSPHLLASVFSSPKRRYTTIERKAHQKYVQTCSPAPST